MAILCGGPQFNVQSLIFGIEFTRATVFIAAAIHVRVGRRRDIACVLIVTHFLNYQNYAPLAGGTGNPDTESVDIVERKVA